MNKHIYFKADVAKEEILKCKKQRLIYFLFINIFKLKYYSLNFCIHVIKLYTIFFYSK